jgi:hypothetical protein
VPQREPKEDAANDDAERTDGGVPDSFGRQTRFAAHDRCPPSLFYLKRNLKTYHSAFSPSFELIFLPSA